MRNLPFLTNICQSPKYHCKNIKACLTGAFLRKCTMYSRKTKQNRDYDFYFILHNKIKCTGHELHFKDLNISNNEEVNSSQRHRFQKMM